MSFLSGRDYIINLLECKKKLNRFFFFAKNKIEGVKIKGLPSLKQKKNYLLNFKLKVLIE